MPKTPAEAVGFLKTAVQVGVAVTAITVLYQGDTASALATFVVLVLLRIESNTANGGK